MSYAYQWQRSANNGTSWSPIDAATTATYTPLAADLGDTLRVNVIATNPDGTASATSDATSAVIGPPKILSAPNAPSGTLQDASTLTADTGTWNTSGATFTYQWVRCPAASTAVDSTCTNIGTGAATYTLAIADVGARIAVTVAATTTGGTSDPAASALSAVVTGRPLQNTVPPSISGSAQVPGTLTANPGTWSLPTTSVSYAWQRCNADGTSGCAQAATGQSYPLTSADANHAIVLYATATGAAGPSATARSPALTISAQPLPQATVAPTVTGTAQRTYTLTASPGTWTNSPTLAGVWQRCNASGQGCADVPGATGPTYADQGQRGATFTYKVTATIRRERHRRRPTERGRRREPARRHTLAGPHRHLLHARRAGRHRARLRDLAGEHRHDLRDLLAALRSERAQLRDAGRQTGGLYRATGATWATRSSRS